MTQAQIKNYKENTLKISGLQMSSKEFKKAKQRMRLEEQAEEREKASRAREYAD